MKAPFNYCFLTILVTLILSGCERFFSNPTPPIDYSGQIDSIKDIEGNIYKTVGIGTQIWIAENLRTTKLNNGKNLTNLTSNSKWEFSKTPGYCYYNNDSLQYSNIFGPLYNFYAIRSDSICPTGWHVPTEKDWNILKEYLGGGLLAGGKMKDIYSSYWNSPNYGIANDYNFSALPGGYRRFDTGIFNELGNEGNWWTSSSIPQYQDHALIMTIKKENTYVSTNTRYKNEGVSIRCLKNK
jgi:uncharacterized protein (TIGR02145 family)